MTTTPSSPPFDFDAWNRLARHDPQAFEIKRRFVIESAILDAPAKRQPQLRRMQWRLDQIRRNSATPLAASLRMQQLLWEHVTGEDGLLARLQRLSGQDLAATPRRSAKILPFRR